MCIQFIAYFEIIWGSNPECRITFYPVIHHQYTQWTSLLEPFVSRVYHSTYLEDEDGASIYSGISLLLTEDDLKVSARCKSFVARPWSVIGRKGAHSESSSMLGIAVKGSDWKSILSPSLLPGLFFSEFPKSPLRLSFGPAIPSTEEPEYVTPQRHAVNGEPTLDQPPDLTDAVIKEGQYPVAHGGYSDVWRATWKRGGDIDDLKVHFRYLLSISLVSVLIFPRSLLRF